VSFADPAQEIDEPPICRARLWSNAGNLITEVEVAECPVGRDLSGEEAFAQRAESDEADAEIFQRRNNRQDPARR
jgi:hypothetical protein